MNNKDYFNSKAESWDTIVAHDMDKVRKIIGLTGVSTGNAVLDVGTGTGVILPVLHAYVGDCGKITAIDISDRMIAVARRKYNYPNVEFVVGDVMENRFQEEQFDCIICYSMFPHFEDQKAAIALLATYLKKDGKLVICHSQSREAINSLHRDLTGPVQNDRLPTAEVLIQYLTEVGLKESIRIDDEDMFVIIGSCISVIA